MIWTTRRRSEVPGGLAVWREGAGPPLVLIHGVGLRAEAWGAMVPLLARQFTVHAVDMPGHGASALAGAATLADYVQRVGDYVDVLDTPVRVAGHSMGAMIAVEVAAERPETVTGVAALNAIHKRNARATEAVQARAAALDGTSVADPATTLSRWFGETPTGALEGCADACRGWLTTVDPAGYAAAYRVFAHENGPSNGTLQRLTMPALFMTAEHDPNSTPAMSTNMATLAPKGRAYTVKDAAHLMPMTHPNEAAREMLHTFGGTP